MISIIIPIYNASKYLNQCLQSIINQSYKNFEVLLIDDGSTDNSKMICKKYLNKDKRFHYLYKHNEGVSSARNLGLEHAKGEYIIFVDSDDYCDTNMLNEIVKQMDKNTLICFGYYQKFKNKNISMSINNCNNKELTKNIYTYIIDSESIGGYLWNKVFSTEIIKRHNIRFKNNVHFLEDMLFVIEYIKFINQVKYINLPLYYYRMRINSVSSDLFSKKNLSMLDALKLLIQQFKPNDYATELLKYNYLYNYYRLKSKNKKEKELIIGNEKDFLKMISKKKKIKIYIVKYCHIIYRCLWKLKINFKKMYN